MTIKLQLLSKRVDLDHEMSANVPMSALPLSAVPFRLKWTSFAHTHEQLHCHSLTVFYCYLLIEGMLESFYTKDGDVFLPAVSLLRIEWNRIRISSPLCDVISPLGHNFNSQG